MFYLALRAVTSAVALEAFTNAKKLLVSKIKSKRKAADRQAYCLIEHADGSPSCSNVKEDVYNQAFARKIKADLQRSLSSVGTLPELSRPIVWEEIHAASLSGC